MSEFSHVAKRYCFRAAEIAITDNFQRYENPNHIIPSLSPLVNFPLLGKVSHRLRVSHAHTNLLSHAHSNPRTLQRCCPGSVEGTAREFFESPLPAPPRRFLQTAESPGPPPGSEPRNPARAGAPIIIYTQTGKSGTQRNPRGLLEKRVGSGCRWKHNEWEIRASTEYFRCASKHL